MAPLAPDEQFEVTLGLLAAYGFGTSSSEQALGYFLQEADAGNAARVKIAFPEIWAQFLALGRELHRTYHVTPRVDFHVERAGPDVVRPLFDEDLAALAEEDE